MPHAALVWRTSSCPVDLDSLSVHSRRREDLPRLHLPSPFDPTCLTNIVALAILSWRAAQPTETATTVHPGAPSRWPLVIT